MLVAEAAADRTVTAAQHLPQQVGSPSRRMFFFARHHVARAHDVVRRFPVARDAPAFPDADTPQGSAGKAAAIVGVLEIGVRLCGVIGRAESKVRGDRVGVDQLSWIHPRERIPDPLEVAKRIDELGTEHDLQQFSARLTVAVFSRERAPVLVRAELRGFGQKRSVVGQALRAFEIELHATMHEALPEVPVERRVVVVFVV